VGTAPFIIFCFANWAQNLGVAFSIMLLAPSWGGMINGLLTLRGVWDKVRVDPVLKFFVVAITGYGMATLKVRCYP
jgi:cytochrome c oxidase cbb3-type subunit I/II